MKKLFFSLVTLLLIGSLTGCGKTTEISINEYIEVEFTGYDTLGSISEYEFDAKEMLSDYEKELEDVSKKEVLKLLGEAFTFDKTSDLSNGEKLEISWDIDEDDLLEFEEENKVKLVYDDFTIVVEDLEELASFDPFETVSVTFNGYAPNASAYVRVEERSDDVDCYDFRYSLDKEAGLSNGDTITVTVEYYYDDIRNYCITQYGMIPSTLSKTFTVSGCPEYIDAVADIPEADLNAMKEYIENSLQEKTTGWVFPESYCGATFMGTAMMTPKEASRYLDQNVLYLVYKVDIDSMRDGTFSYYYYGKLTDLYRDGAGVLVYDVNNISLAGSGWYGTSFLYKNLKYSGYQTYDELYAEEIKPMEDSYNVENEIDQSLVDKVTHTPKDYSALTAELKLGADCFTYKWYQGYYMVSGLTEKGYKELEKYSASDYVALVLPSVNENGEAVEGFYSSSAEGGYKFSQLINGTLPCLKLVCPSSYKYMYGFKEDHRFDSTYAFKLRAIELNEGLLEIGESAFDSCTGLTEISIPDSVTTIGKWAFSNCNNLVIDTLDISDKKVSGSAFYGVTIKSVIFHSEGYIADRSSSWGTVYAPFDGAYIKQLVIGENVTTIPDYAFELAIGPEKIVIPASVTKIGTRAFANNSTIKTVTLPEGLSTVDAEAFQNCNELRTVNIPDSLVDIREKAFADCELLVIAPLELSGRKIDNDAFYGATMQELILSGDDYEPVRNVSWSTVYTPWNGAIVKKITINEGVTEIPAFAFEYCGSVSEVVLPATVVSVGEGAFHGCKNLKTVILNEGLETIGSEAFKECQELRTVNIPATVTAIGASAFYNCSYLLIDKLDMSGMHVESYAFYQATIGELVLDSNEFTANRYVGWGNIDTPWTGAIVKNLVITQNVTEIPDYAFENLDSLERLTLPSGVVKIGERAFAECSSLKKIYIPASVKEIAANAFESTPELTIAAPSGSEAESFATEKGIKFVIE